LPLPTLNVEAPPASIQIAVEAPAGRKATPATLEERLGGAALLFVLTLAAIAINGYHPYSEDAGIYVAGIKQAANPVLYGSSAVFVTASSHMSRFSAFNAWLARSLSVSLDLQLFATQVLTTWLLLYACWKLACLCFRRNETRWASVVMVAVCLSVPVAGSSLFMLDPYVTARSFTMPFTLLAIAACLDGEMLRAGLLLTLVALFHPLMAIYAAGFLMLLWAIRRESSIGTAALIVSAVAAGAAIQFTQRAVIESTAYRAAVATRPYFFLADWHWYELLGLAAPLALLAIFTYWQSGPSSRNRPAFFAAFACNSAAMLACTSIVIGLTSIAVSLLFVHPGSRSHFIAAMQPMRAFIVIYLCMFLLLGGVLGEFWLRREPWRWVVLFACIGAAIAFFQNQAYPASAHLELPGATNGNGWNQAFLWIRANTPLDAIVALDANYIHARGEDARGFRAVAERGSLADASKDGGAAAVFPQLAERWMTEHAAQAGLNAIDDAERLRRLAPFHVSWIVLDRQATTAMSCPFQNDLVKVCRLR